MEVCGEQAEAACRGRQSALSREQMDFAAHVLHRSNYEVATTVDTSLARQLLYLLHETRQILRVPQLCIDPPQRALSSSHHTCQGPNPPDDTNFSATAQAMPNPSQVEVPRPSSSTITRAPLQVNAKRKQYTCGGSQTTALVPPCKGSNLVYHRVTAITLTATGTTAGRVQKRQGFRKSTTRCGCHLLALRRIATVSNISAMNVDTPRS